ncbi:MAG: SGNH/GDSL hydrolase family protein [Chitinophagaceae bacterium]|nr:SGNH/GDSL hydrolase family protein [Chitinophagaceae bacterium]
MQCHSSKGGFFILMKSKVRKQLLYSLYLFFITFLALEIILRIYNPFHFRLKYDNLILPVNQKVVITNSINDKLDRQIINTRNSLGFRGPNKPKNFDGALSLITVGGSTTECKFLSEGKTWPDQLEKHLKLKFKNLWLNNAGIDGHSTFGHQVLLNDYLIKLRPKVILFLVGINDVENDQPTFHDKLNMKDAYSDLKHFIFTNSEVLSLVLNLVRGWRSQKLNNTTQKKLTLNPKNVLDLPDSLISARLKQQNKYLPNYKRRVEQLIDTCTKYKILPVFITQPNLLGYGIESTTKTDLARFRLGDMNGKLLWQMLSVYNQITIKTCNEKSVPVIDLATLMPKRSVYFYDHSHFTNQGAEKVAEILSVELEKILRGKFPAYYLSQ